MRKVIYASLVIVVCLFTGYRYFTKPLTKSTIKVHENIRVIAYFNDSLVQGSTITTQVGSIRSVSIRSLLEQFRVRELKAVFLNRYGENGFLKPVEINNSVYDTLKGWQEIMIEDNGRAAELVSLLGMEAGVLYAHIERPLPFKPCIAPNDSLFLYQWHLNNPSNPLADIRAEQAWNINKGRNDVIIAVCDGGVDYTHPDLDPGDRSRVIAGYDATTGGNNPMDNLPDGPTGSYGGHGTNIAGIIGAITNNSSGVAGIMWNCKIMPVKMVGGGGVYIKYPFGSFNWDFSTTAFPSDVADAIDYAVNNGAHVINLSYGFAGMGWPVNDVILKVPLLYSTISNAYNQNVVVVVAMGNEYEQGNPINYPAAFAHEVIAVGNTNWNFQRSSSSSTGPHINVSAPGSGIYTTDRGGGTGSHSGTSMAAPVVSGVAGLIISQGLDRNFNLTNDDVRHILEKTSDDMADQGFDNETGYGKVNAFNALQLLNQPNEVVHGVSYGGSTTKTNLNRWLYTGSSWNLAAGMYFNVDRYKIAKRVNFEVPFCSPPVVWIRERQSACLSFASPNDGYPYAEITNVTETGFDVTYCTYYVRYNSAAQEINRWAPATISNSKIAYTAVGEPNIAATAGPISGPTTVCSSNATFTLSNLPNGCTVTWTKSSNLVYVSGQDTSYTVKALSPTTSGFGWVQATVAGPCGNVPPIRYNVSVGPPVRPHIRCGSTTQTTGSASYTLTLGSPTTSLQLFFVDPPGTAYATSWEVVKTGSPQNFNVVQNGNYVLVNPLGVGTGVFTVRALNACGESSVTRVYLTINKSGGGEPIIDPPEFPIRLSPNPARGEVVVGLSSELQAELANSRASDKASVMVTSGLGRVVYSGTFRHGGLRLNLAGWHSGSYQVVVVVNAKRYATQLIVK